MLKQNRLPLFGALALGALALQACGSTVQTPQVLDTRTGQIATAGAVLGGVAGALTGDDSTERRQHGTIGAVAGGIVGAAVGQYFDQQQQQLTQNLAGSGITVSRPDEQTINLNIPGDVTFASNSAAVSPQFYGTLDQVASVLTSYPQTQVVVLGHTDNRGAYQYNQTLSENRANAVGQYLYQRGVTPNRIATGGRSFSQPIASNNTAAGQARNRRVDISIVPLQ